MIAISEYERALSLPTGYINFAISAGAPTGAWQRLERNEIPLDMAFFAAFARDIRSPTAWRRFHDAKSLPVTAAAPPLVDGEALFWRMMAKGQTRDTVVMNAVRRLRKAGVKVGALTNDYRYPDEHPYLEGKDELKREFDVWVSSAESGMRKPEEGVYREAMRLAGVEDGGQVAFLDDIGVNLKAAAGLGWKTVKVSIGKSREAVEELERVVGLKLLDEEEGTKSRL